MLTFLAYIVAGIFSIGFLWKIFVYARSPAPLLIPTTPAPVTRSGVVWRLFREVVFFESLFKADKLLWIVGYAFHATLALVLIRHIRYFVDPLPEIFAHYQIVGILAGLAMVGALAFLLARRFVIDRVRHISSPADYLILLLLLGIGTSGLLMDFILRPDIIAIKHAMTTLWTSSAASLSLASPGDVVFILHLIMVAALIIIFPFSKLMHLGGIFFSPTRNQVDNPREQRHINPWYVEK
ncbi:MAG: respiratory nitrate reductase subunit gamma [Magnetococcales bacterium]|nr:respiratory nitrate reductase subunit gamma [Magnetococcales bacterium]MBF0347650.1 respiratory nitrate reductase subunit gamma [Magnetococcales bacterium]